MSVQENLFNNPNFLFEANKTSTAINEKIFGKSNSMGGNDTEEPQKLQLLKFVDMINSSDKDQQLEGLIAIRKLLSLKENPPIQEIIETGVVPKLLEFMKLDHDQKFQYESAWAVTNICSGTSQHVEFVVGLGGLDVIINLLGSPSADVLDQAVWALGNVAGDNVAYRNMCLELGSMDKLVNVLGKFFDNTNIKRNAVWAMSNLLRGKPVPAWDAIAKGIPSFNAVLAAPEFDEAVVDALWGISWASETYIQQVIDSGSVPHLVHHLNNNQLNVLIPALRALGNIVTGDDSQTNTVLNQPNFLKRVFALTSNPKKGVRKEACWLISNVAAGNQTQIAQIINEPDYVAALRKALTTDVQEVVTEAAWALGNLASGASHVQIKSLVEHDSYLKCLHVMLTNASVKVKHVGLEASLNVIKAYNDDSQHNKGAIMMKKEKIMDDIENIMDSGADSLQNLANEIYDYFENLSDSGSELEPSNIEMDVPEKPGSNDKSSHDEDESEEEEEGDYMSDDDEDDKRLAVFNKQTDDDEIYKNMERED